MALIKSGMLKRIQGLIGTPGSSLGPVNLEDESVTQVLPVIPEIARRGLAPGTIGGWGTGLMENVHSGADFESSSIDPYLAGVAAVGAYPAEVPLEFDVWLLGVSAQQTSGTPGLDGAFLLLNPVASQQMWGVDDGGLQVVGDPPLMLARWDAIDSTVTTTGDILIAESGEVYLPINIRIPRSGCLIAFHTESAGAAEYQATLLMGLFPAALGQDVVT